jgi:molybdopterin molybdotransferase
MAEERRLTYAQAVTAILDASRHGRRVVAVPIRDAAGLILAEEARSDIDMPAFDRAAMDGFAFRHDEAKDPASEFRVVATIAAGEWRAVSLGPRDCVAIMTGAPVPDGADTVIPIEETSAFSPKTTASATAPAPESVRFTSVPAKGSHIAPRGQDVRRDSVVLTEGCRLQAQEIAILASIGYRSVPVYAGPAIAYAATGEELVEPGEPLRPGAIRNSNAYTLGSQILTARAIPHYLGILPDRPEALREKIAEGLERDLLVLSGGVSMGEFDYVPQVLEALGVRILFQKLLVRPGQPTLFGVRDHGEKRTLVFGLPGNPISTWLAFDQYVAPAVRVFRGHPQPLTPVLQGELTEAMRKRGAVLMLVPCRARWVEGRYQLDPRRFHGSGDIFAVTGANAVAYLPAGIDEVAAGTRVDFRMLHQD